MNINDMIDLDSFNVFDNTVDSDGWEDESLDNMLDLPDESLDQKAYRASYEANKLDEKIWGRDYAGTADDGVHAVSDDALIYEND